MLKSNTVSTGLAMFSMFFGAGNIVFPLAVGQMVTDMHAWAIFGMMLTAVAVPLLGLTSMTLFNGQYHDFFARIGQYPGALLMLVLMLVIGPFGAVPRCITLSYETINHFLPGMPLWIFNLIACGIIFILTYRESRLLDILGYYLTPVLLFLLAVIVVKGLLQAPEIPVGSYEPLQAFWKGIQEGYQTMDLLGGLFFSSVVIICLTKELNSEGLTPRILVNLTLKAALIAAVLLGIVYMGFIMLSASHAEELAKITQSQILSAVAMKVLGPVAGLAASAAVALACLTTAMALSAVFAEYLEREITKHKLNYTACLIITLVLTYFTALLNFEGIVRLVGPALQVVYPALIVLSLCNLLYKLYGFDMVKTPFYMALTASVVGYFW